jgi:predicted transcriptional regulator
MSEDVKELRRQVKALVDQLPSDKLYRILEVIEDEDGEEEMPDALKASLEEAIAQSERGEGQQHEEAMKEVRQWLKK